MTPRELACAIEAVAGPSQRPLGRAVFADLMKKFPDQLSPRGGDVTRR
jgi:uncharacterized phage protein (TIGR02216 family)